MRVLGVDASSTAVGWAVFEDGQYEDSGVLVLQGPDWIERVKHLEAAIYLWLSKKPTMLERAPERIDHVVYERASGAHRNMRTDRILGAVEYVILGACRIRGVPYTLVSPMQVKQSGVCKSAQGQAMAEALIGRPLDASHPGDEADAIGLALTYNPAYHQAE